MEKFYSLFKMSAVFLVAVSISALDYVLADSCQDNTVMGCYKIEKTLEKECDNDEILQPAEYSAVRNDIAVGAAGTTDSDERMAWLFPDGIPENPEEMEKYLIWIKVPCKTETGMKDAWIQVHTKLAEDVTEIYREMAELEGYYVLPEETYGYDWRLMASGTGSLSHHSYGAAIDVNTTANPAVYWEKSPDVESIYYNNPKVVAIWKAHGFYWGGDWSEDFYDPMHFSYTDH